MSCTCHDPSVFGHLCHGEYTAGDVLTIQNEIREEREAHRNVRKATTVVLNAIREVLECLAE